MAILVNGKSPEAIYVNQHCYLLDLRGRSFRIKSNNVGCLRLHETDGLTPWHTSPQPLSTFDADRNFTGKNYKIMSSSILDGQLYIAFTYNNGSWDVYLAVKLSDVNLVGG